jgi:hypothetical protein
VLVEVVVVDEFVGVTAVEEPGELEEEALEVTLELELELVGEELGDVEVVVITAVEHGVYGLAVTQEQRAFADARTAIAPIPQLLMTQFPADTWITEELAHWQLKSPETHPTAEPAEIRHPCPHNGIASPAAWQGFAQAPAVVVDDTGGDVIGPVVDDDVVVTDDEELDVGLNVNVEEVEVGILNDDVLLEEDDEVVVASVELDVAALTQLHKAWAEARAAIAVTAPQLVTAQPRARDSIAADWELEHWHA